MYMDDLLPLLHKVRRTSKGVMALCPAHEDRQPSLSLRETEDRILLHCFAGCRVEAICSALGMRMRDLFHNTASTHDIRQAQQARIIREQKQMMEYLQKGRAIDARREAEALLRASRNQDISQWSPAKFDWVMNAIGLAYTLLRQEEEEGWHGFV